jgi:uncharacterized protein (DUF1330 family)
VNTGIFEFEPLREALAFYESPEYAPIKAERNGSFLLAVPESRQ